ncbi:MAG: cell division protein FtsZ [Rhodospirillaceae bacterium]|jgi:cell division protein FtsZ|nr:cell division protein FtsZ [Rhodospirillaceae bacterium]
MTINLSVPVRQAELKPRITVIGIGGAGGNAIDNMIRDGMEGVEFIATNTDAQALAGSEAQRKIQLGAAITQGLGAGSRPDIGRAAADETMDEIIEHISGTHMAFITAGMGGGTGTGAAPVIARAAREMGILTVGVVTKPFNFEGANRMRTAEEGVEELSQYVDTLIIIPNQNLFRVANEKTTFADAFKLADDVLRSGVGGVTDLMVKPGLINLDFADIRSVMTEMGKAQMGTGESEGEKRAIESAEAAIANPLLDDASMKGARGVLINISGGPDMTMFEVDEAANRIKEEVDVNANIIFGTSIEDSMEGRMRVSVVATGIDASLAMRPENTNISLLAEHKRAADEFDAEIEEEQAEMSPMEEIIEADDGEDLEIAPSKVGTFSFLSSGKTTTPEMPAYQSKPLNAGPTSPGPMASSTSTVSATSAAPAASPAPEMHSEPFMETPQVIGNTAAALYGPSPLSKPMESVEEKKSPPKNIKSHLARIAPPFLAPRPVEPNRGDEDENKPDPFASAAMANAIAEKEPRPNKARVSLLKKMTGVGQSSEPVAEKKEAPSEAVETAPIITSASPQPKLGGLNPEERLPTSETDDDLLDIPAFLRRQAN